MGYTNWGSEAFDNSLDEDCVTASPNLGWTDLECNCGDIAKALCVEKMIPTCPDETGWVIINGRCFYISSSNIFYSEAEADCTDNRGGRLFEPKNKAANEKMYNYVQSISRIPYWIGINAITDPGNYKYASTGTFLRNSV